MTGREKKRKMSESPYFLLSGDRWQLTVSPDTIETALRAWSDKNIVTLILTLPSYHETFDFVKLYKEYIQKGQRGQIGQEDNTQEKLLESIKTLKAQYGKSLVDLIEKHANTLEKINLNFGIEAHVADRFELVDFSDAGLDKYLNQFEVLLTEVLPECKSLKSVKYNYKYYSEGQWDITVLQNELPFQDRDDRDLPLYVFSAFNSVHISVFFPSEFPTIESKMQEIIKKFLEESPTVVEFDFLRTDFLITLDSPYEPNEDKQKLFWNNLVNTLAQLDRYVKIPIIENAINDSTLVTKFQNLFQDLDVVKEALIEFGYLDLESKHIILKKYKEMFLHDPETQQIHEKLKYVDFSFDFSDLLLPQLPPPDEIN